MCIRLPSPNQNGVLMKVELEKFTITATKQGGGAIENSLLERETCPFCGLPNCNYSCDESQAGGFSDEAKANEESDADVLERLNFNAGLEVMENFTLALVCAFHRRNMTIPVDVINEAIATTLDTMGSDF